MKMSEIQLLIYGDNIAQLIPKIETEGVKLTSVDRVQNKNYLFLNLLIETNAKPGFFNIDFYKGKKKKYTKAYRLIERRKMLLNLKAYSC